MVLKGLDKQLKSQNIIFNVEAVTKRLHIKSNRNQLFIPVSLMSVLLSVLSSQLLIEIAPDDGNQLLGIGCICQMLFLLRNLIDVYRPAH